MQILMGGSGSTGSSLLKNILNRHPEIFAGGETAFFAKKMIYDDWQSAKSRVLRRKLFGLKNYGWHIYNGADLLQKEYEWTKSDLQSALIQSKSLQDFTSQFYNRPLQSSGGKIWLEKTPANSACFNFFLDSFKTGKVVHVVRNPYDTISSLVNRGYNLFYASGIYLLNTASGLNVEGNSRALIVKYEDLILNPEETIRKLCIFLGIEFIDSMLQPQGEKVHKPKLDGWHYDETKKIRKGAIGRFKKLTSEQQNSIIEASNMIKVNGRGQRYYNSKIESIQDICTALGYEFYVSSKTSSYKKLMRMRLKDRLMRLGRNYPTGIYYPLDIRK